MHTILSYSDAWWSHIVDSILLEIPYCWRFILFPVFYSYKQEYFTHLNKANVNFLVDKIFADIHYDFYRVSLCKLNRWTKVYAITMILIPIPLWMCGISPHTTKQFSDIRCVSYNSTHFWYFLPEIASSDPTG